jgi:hypothetical protein
MRKASFAVVVEDNEEGDDRITVEFKLIDGDEDLMIDVVQAILKGGRDPKILGVVEN